MKKYRENLSSIHYKKLINQTFDSILRFYTNCSHYIMMATNGTIKFGQFEAYPEKDIMIMVDMGDIQENETYCGLGKYIYTDKIRNTHELSKNLPLTILEAKKLS